MDFNEEIKQIKTEKTVLAIIKSKSVILRSKERDRRGEVHKIFFKKIINKGWTILQLKKRNWVHS